MCEWLIANLVEILSVLGMVIGIYMVHQVAVRDHQWRMRQIKRETIINLTHADFNPGQPWIFTTVLNEVGVVFNDAPDVISALSVILSKDISWGPNEIPEEFNMLCRAMYKNAGLDTLGYMQIVEWRPTGSYEKA